MPSAVLVLCSEGVQGVEVLLTRRSQRVRDHKGQVSFPGGVIEPTDPSPLAAALREAHEEVGLDPGAVTVFGQLSDYVTVTGYHIRPYVASTESFEGLEPRSPEIERVFAFPLWFMLDDSRITRVPATRLGREEDLLFVEYDGETIWGATARIIYGLAKLAGEVAK